MKQEIRTTTFVNRHFSDGRSDRIYRHKGRACFAIYRVLNDKTPTARFKIRMADKQENAIMWMVGFWSVKSFKKLHFNGTDCVIKKMFNYNPLAPISPRIVDELLCNEFKRK